MCNPSSVRPPCLIQYTTHTTLIILIVQFKKALSNIYEYYAPPEPTLSEADLLQLEEERLDSPTSARRRAGRVMVGMYVFQLYYFLKAKYCSVKYMS